MSGCLPAPAVITIRHAEPGEDGVAITCECGTVTRLVIEGAEYLTQERRMVFTCGGCQKVVWYEAGPVGRSISVGYETPAAG